MKFIKVLSANILFLLVLLVLLLTGVSLVLKSVTRHGEALTVPDITGLTLEQALPLLEQKQLRYLIIDSLYFDDKPKLSILDQNPMAESKVKEGRVIYLLINSDKPPGVVVPNIIDVSLRQAEAMLKGSGLKTGTMTYKPDLARDVILEMMLQGQSIQPGVKIPKGTAVDLVLGDGLIDAVDVPLPDLNGLTLEESRNLLTSSSLQLGAVVYQGKISDSSAAKVFRQVPEFQTDAQIKTGATVDLYLKQ